MDTQIDDEEITYPRACRILQRITLLANEHILTCHECATTLCPQLHWFSQIEGEWSQRVISLRLRGGYEH